jgi:hypothetical protein
MPRIRVEYEGETQTHDVDELRSQVSPKLVQDNLELEPVVVTRLGGTLPFDTSSKQLQCGETVTDSGGEKNLRLVYHAVVTKTQFDTLARMRKNGDSVELISTAYSGPATFDELKFDRITDANGAVIRGEGTTREPLYEIQLQSKQNTSEGDS